MAALARRGLQAVYPALLHRIPTPRLATEVAPVPFTYDAVSYGVHESPVTW
ncbi:hypothetical protein [Streptomyces sp. PU-14G]|uniref:hypothetical protein n=1 Tax=Streptomyces sp. PU-14G TaxID=2800808 RepID=UPI0034DE662F